MPFNLENRPAAHIVAAANLRKRLVTMIAAIVAAIATAATMTMTKNSETVSGRRGAGPAGEIPVAEPVAIKRRRTAPKAAKEAAMRTAPAPQDLTA